MSKFTCILLCTVAVRLSAVYAGEEEKSAFHEAIKPFATECAKEHGISDADLAKAKDSHDPDILMPCFIGCVFKKFEIINDKGEYDSATNLAKIKKFVKNDDHYAILSDIAKKCDSVNSESVSDGTAGCERAVLVAKCFMDHKSEISM